MECRLDPVTHEYTQSHLYDYPSAGLISDVLNANLITPIFAVPSGVRSVYDGLVAAIRSATVETLSTDSSGIINLIENQYTVRGWGCELLCGWGCLDANSLLWRWGCLHAVNCYVGGAAWMQTHCCGGGAACMQHIAVGGRAAC